MNSALIGLRASVLALGAVWLAACGSSNASPNDAKDGGSSITLAGEEGGAPVDITPIATSSMAANTWTYVPVDGAMCRDGSATGIVLNLNPSSTNLVIYLEGGGACFNDVTCLENPSCFSPPGKSGCLLSFDGRFGASGTNDGGGILSRTDAANPVKDWNMVYVPFCTGDVHAGAKTNGMVAGVTAPQQFVGYLNMTRYLARLVPTFPHLSKVLLTGISAGGFGAAANYPQVAKAFAPVPVYDLDDSGPPMETPYLASCLQNEWVQTWGLDKTVLADCGSDCPDPTNFALDAVIHTARLYPQIPFGLVEDTDDMIITLFYGYGNNNCAPVPIATPVDGATFTAGLLDERAKVLDAGLTNTAGFIFQGTAHTSLGASSTFDSVTAGGDDAGPAVKLSDWVTTLVNDGTVTNVGP